MDIYRISVGYINITPVCDSTMLLRHYKCQTINNHNLSILRLKATSLALAPPASQPTFAHFALAELGLSYSSMAGIFHFHAPNCFALDKWSRVRARPGQKSVCVCTRQVIKITNNDDYEYWLHVINFHFKLLCHYIMVYMPEYPSESSKLGQSSAKQGKVVPKCWTFS